MAYISSIQEKLMEIIKDSPINLISDFLVSNGADRNEMTDAYHMALWIEGAPKSVKHDFLDGFNEEDCPPMRICDNCGCFMDEGYLLDTQYACSDKCAIALYDGNEEQLREDIRLSVEEDEGDFF